MLRLLVTTTTTSKYTSGRTSQAELARPDVISWETILRKYYASTSFGSQEKSWPTKHLHSMFNTRKYTRPLAEDEAATITTTTTATATTTTTTTTASEL